MTVCALVDIASSAPRNVAMSRFMSSMIRSVAPRRSASRSNPVNNIRSAKTWASSFFICRCTSSAITLSVGCVEPSNEGSAPVESQGSTGKRARNAQSRRCDGCDRPDASEIEDDACLCPSCEALAYESISKPLTPAPIRSSVNASAPSQMPPAHLAARADAPLSQAKATEGKAGTAGAQGPVRQTTAGTGLRVGEPGAVLTATSEFMDVTAGETASNSELVCVGPSLIRDLDAGRGERTERRSIDPIEPDPAGGAVKAWSAGPRAITGNNSSPAFPSLSQADCDDAPASLLFSSVDVELDAIVAALEIEFRAIALDLASAKNANVLATAAESSISSSIIINP